MRTMRADRLRAVLFPISPGRAPLSPVWERGGEPPNAVRRGEGGGLRAVLFAVLACLLIGCASAGATPAAQVSAPTAEPTTAPEPTPTPEPEPAYQPIFEPTSCRLPLMPRDNVECGDLIVPENRANPDGRTIRLHVAIFRARTDNPAPDPVIHLGGGPGAALLDDAVFYLQAGGNAIRMQRDYIMFSQRGTAYADPKLECNEYALFLWQSAEEELDDEEKWEQAARVVAECRDRLARQGIDLAAYNSAENAADVEDLRRALGYEQVNLYGISYGTRLALTVLREYPDSVRSVILDSVYPPQVNLYSEMPSNAGRALNAVFENCARDPACNAAYPNLEQTFFETYDLLEEQPLTIPLFGPDRQYVVRFDGELFASMLFARLYTLESLPYIPRWIEDAQERNAPALMTPLSNVIGFDVAPGMYWSIQCGEEVAFETEESAAQAAAELPPQLAGAFAAAPILRVCEAWGVGPADPIENEPVESDVPALVFAGEYDPITPPEWARLAAETLPNSYLYEFEGVGHGVVRSDGCALLIALQFLDDPTAAPNDSCIAEREPLRFDTR